MTGKCSANQQQLCAKHALYPIILMVCLSISLWGCSPSQEMAEPLPEGITQTRSSTQDQLETYASLENIQQKGVLVVGTAITKPFEYHEPETGELRGFDVDIANHIAKKMGVELEWVEMPFANLLPALQEKKIDMTIAAMYITPEREAQIDFSTPYIKTGLIMVGQPETTKHIRNLQDLSGLSVGVKIGATGETLAKDLRIEGIDLSIVEYKDTLDSLLDLEVGRVDVVFNDYLNTLIYINEYQSDLSILTDENGNIMYLSQAGLGIAVHPSNQVLLSEINSILDTMEKDGITHQLYRNWFNIKYIN
jgi:polar amino acid transport system substrate-binding protein